MNTETPIASATNRLLPEKDCYGTDSQVATLNVITETSSEAINWPTPISFIPSWAPIRHWSKNRMHRRNNWSSIFQWLW